MIEYKGFRCEYTLNTGDKIVLYVNNMADIKLDCGWLLIKDCLGREHGIKRAYIIYTSTDSSKTKMILAEMKL